MIKIFAFRWVPSFAEGLVRDLRVRWALEEAGLSYEVQLIGREDQASERYRCLQPFGQVPAYEEDDLVLFESGAIVLHIAEKSAALMPSDANARARVTSWMFSALNTMEPPIQNLAAIDLFYANEDWAKQRRPGAEKAVIGRLEILSTCMNGRDYLEGSFSAADILMTTVLRNLRQTDLLARFPALDAYKQRCEARPAFQKSLADQLAPFAENAPG